MRKTEITVVCDSCGCKKVSTSEWDVQNNNGDERGFFKIDINVDGQELAFGSRDLCDGCHSLLLELVNLFKFKSSEISEKEPGYEA
jgi:hypothetical protein